MQLLAPYVRQNSKNSENEDVEVVPWALRNLFEVRQTKNMNTQWPDFSMRSSQTYGDEIAAMLPKFSLAGQSLSSFPRPLLKCHGLKELNLSSNRLCHLCSDR